MRAISFSLIARSQLLDIARYLYRRTGDERSGTKLVRAIEAHVQKAASLSAQIGRPRDDLGDGFRSLVHDDYLIFVRYEEDAIAVHHVLHGHRDVEAYFDSLRDN